MSKAQVIDTRQLFQNVITFSKSTAQKIQNVFKQNRPEKRDFFTFCKADMGNDLAGLDIPMLEASALEMPFVDIPIPLELPLEPEPVAMFLDEMPPFNLIQREWSVVEPNLGQQHALPSSTQAETQQLTEIPLRTVLTFINEVTGLEAQEVKSLPAGAIKITLTIQQPEYAEV